MSAEKIKAAERAADAARARVTKAEKTLDGAKKALEKACTPAGGGGGEIEFTVKNDKWVICSATGKKVRNDPVDKAKHIAILKSLLVRKQLVVVAHELDRSHVCEVCAIHLFFRLLA